MRYLVKKLGTAKKHSTQNLRRFFWNEKKEILFQVILKKRFRKLLYFSSNKNANKYLCDTWLKNLGTAKKIHTAKFAAIFLERKKVILLFQFILRKWFIQKKKCAYFFNSKKKTLTNICTILG